MRRLRDLELRHLVAFDAVAREGTFAKAATHLGYTQSAVSQQIASLERHVGTAMFDRPGGPRPVELTPAGELMLTHAREIIARVDVAGDSVERFLAGEDNHLTIGTFQSVSNVLLPQVVVRLKAEMPDLDISVFEAESDHGAPDRVESGELDISFYVQSPVSLQSIVLLDDPFLLITKAGELPPGPVPTARLRGKAMIAYQPSPCQTEIETKLSALGADIHTRTVFRTNDNGAVCSMVRSGMGWAVIPSLALDSHERGLDVHPLDPAPASRQILLGWRRGRTLAPATRRLVAIAKDVASELDAQNLNRSA